MSIDQSTHHTEEDHKTPVLLAYTSPQHPKSYLAWCPHCVKYHFHGRQEGHRSAHCPDGPFKETGYMLQAAGPLPE